MKTKKKRVRRTQEQIAALKPAVLELASSKSVSAIAQETGLAAGTINRMLGEVKAETKPVKAITKTVAKSATKNGNGKASKSGNGAYKEDLDAVYEVVGVLKGVSPASRDAVLQSAGRLVQSHLS